MNYLWIGFLWTSLLWGMAIEVSAQPEVSGEPNVITPSPTAAQQLDLNPQILESSPVLQRWSEEIPNVLSTIRSDPSFRTRVRVGYSSFPSSEQVSGIHLGIEDVFVSDTHLTINADYQSAFDGSREAYGSEIRYYALPLGSSVNVAPVIGYRWLDGRYNIDGVTLGMRLQWQLSRTGAADIILAQNWVNPGAETEEVGITTLTFGYALTQNLRLSTDLQQQNAPQHKDRRLGIGLEWML